MPKRQSHKPKILALFETKFPDGASAERLARAYWDTLSDEEKHNLAWRGLLRQVQDVLGSKDRQGLPIAIPVSEKDDGGRMWVPLGNTAHQHCFDYFQECIKGIENDLSSLRVFWRYMNQRWPENPPPKLPELGY